MKSLLFIALSLNLGCAAASPPSAKFTVRVVDVESGKPITNTIVQTGFTQKEDSWGLGVGKATRLKERVDKSGQVTFEGESIYAGRGGSVSADGYYSQSFEAESKKNVVLNRWEPWNQLIDVRLRPKKNPVPMVRQSVRNNQIPLFDKPIGFDLEKGDWVKPHGSGLVDDLIITASKVKTPKEGIRYSIGFSNPLDGIQEYYVPENMRSSYEYPYKAPLEGYTSTFNRYRLLKYPILTDYPANNLKEDGKIRYIFRVRTQLDNDGNIVSANYGRIGGEIKMSMKGALYFSYYFNPNSKCRSLESDKNP